MSDVVIDAEVKKHTFNQGVDTILNECLSISDQRGGEYQDTWNLKNISTPAISHVLRMQSTFDQADEMLYKRWRRLMLMASLIDVKLSRLLGPYKEDTLIDLINYSACFAYLMREWKEATANRVTITTEKQYAEIPTFNDDVTADLHTSSPPHWHFNSEIVLPDDNTGWNRTSRHMSESHRQDGSPIFAHRPSHVQETHAEAWSRSYMDSEYGPA